MGIDIYLKWDGMTEKERMEQFTGMSTVAGETGYLREAYHGGPYATKILCREAFESEDCVAEIPASVLRQRLTQVTEPARYKDLGHVATEMLINLLTGSGADFNPPAVQSGETEPMTVEEAVRERYNRLYPTEPPAHVEAVVQSFRNFVNLAERKEKETGKPCTVYASY